MNRRNFLKLASSIIAWPLAAKILFRPKIGSAAISRLEKWAPASDPSIRVEWRYAAGRITDSNQDFGFIISLSDIRVSGLQSQQCLIQRQDFNGDKQFVGKTYTGTLTYDSATATYTFETDQELVRWQWDETNQLYKLTVTSPELLLEDLVLIPQGPLILEGGDGNVKVGRIGNNLLESDYYADWTNIEIGGKEIGVARIDMQGTRRSGVGSDSIDDYDHQWFVVAAELNNGLPIWVSAWKIEDPEGPFWCVTIAQGSGVTWQQISSVTEENEGAMTAPLQITTLNSQSLPLESTMWQGAGAKWLLTAGISQATDLLNLQINVPPGQFVSGNIDTTSNWLLEATGIEAEGTILGNPISSVKLVVAESSTETEFYLNFLPFLLK